MEKRLLNLTPSNPLALVKQLFFFDNSIELYVLMECYLHISVHDPIHYIFPNALKVDFYKGQ